MIDEDKNTLTMSGIMALPLNENNTTRLIEESYHFCIPVFKKSTWLLFAPPSLLSHLLIDILYYIPCTSQPVN